MIQFKRNAWTDERTEGWMEGQTNPILQNPFSYRWGVQLMTKFSNKFKKPCFWPILGTFSQFLGQKKISWKICLHNFIWVSSTMPQLEKVNDTIQRKRLDRRKDGQKGRWKDPILQDPSGYRRGSKKCITHSIRKENLLLARYSYFQLALKET